MTILVVRRSFRNRGTRYLPGDIIKSPEDIKLLKCKLTENTILAFDRQDPNTIPLLKVLSEKVGRPVLDAVKAYLKEIDSEVTNYQEVDTDVDDKENIKE